MSKYDPETNQRRARHRHTWRRLDDTQIGFSAEEKGAVTVWYYAGRSPHLIDGNWVYKDGRQKDGGPKIPKSKNVTRLHRIRQAVLVARKMMTKAVDELRTSDSVLSKNVFMHHFGIDNMKSKEAATVIENFSKILNGINEDVVIADVNPEKEAKKPSQGYVSKTTYSGNEDMFERGESSYGDIHLNYDKLLRPTEIEQEKKDSPYELHVNAVARIIIHEASHKFADTEDHWYCDEVGYDSRPISDKTTNAETYSYAVLSLFEGRVMGIIEFDTFTGGMSE